MTAPDQLQDDLQFIRKAVEQRRQLASPKGILWVWAIFVLIGYSMLDINQPAAGVFFAIAGPICGIISAVIGARAANRAGENDRAEGRIEFLHWMGALLAVLSVVAMQLIHPQLRGNLGGQLIVIAIGIVYYCYGVHRDPNFLWLGILIIVGAIALSFVPWRPWTCLGVVFALGLVVPTFFRRRDHAQA